MSFNLSFSVCPIVTDHRAFPSQQYKFSLGNYKGFHRRHWHKTGSAVFGSHQTKGMGVPYCLNGSCSIPPVDTAGIDFSPNYRCKVQAILTLSVKTASPLPGNAKASVLTIILGNQAKCFPLLIVPKKWIFYVNIGVIEAKDRLLRQPSNTPSGLSATATPSISGSPTPRRDL